MRSAFYKQACRPLGAFAIAVTLCTFAALTSVPEAFADETGASEITLPKMDADAGKSLFADRGCVVCHSINNVGGDTGPSLDASNLNQSRDPFEFFARMWRGAEPMLHLQQADLGYQIDFSGQDLADIFAFVQDGTMQEGFTEADLPDHIREIIDNGPSVPQE
ncbi:MAG: c-type cytochrome [Thalassospira sp.]|uniref:c-type cytochrome n=1 Tax=Thalassospira sp. TaxID=1912094 RepID=UPI0032EC16C5